MSDKTIKIGKILIAQFLAFLTSSFLVTYVFIGQTPIVRPNVVYSFAQLPNKISTTVKSAMNREKSKVIVNVPQRNGYPHETNPNSTVYPSNEKVIIDQTSQTNIPSPSNTPTISPPTLPDSPSPTLLPSPTIIESPPTQPPSPTATPRPRPTATPKPPTTSESGSTTLEQDVIRIINQKRSEANLRSLTANSALAQAARRLSRDNAKRSSPSECSHTGSDGSNFQTRAAAAGFAGKAYGETLGCAYVSAQSIVDGWWSSPQHHAILTNSSITLIGVGWVKDKQTAQTTVVGF